MKWLIAVVALLVAALILQSGLLAYAMYVLLGVLVVSRVLTRAWINNLSATRSCDREAAEVGESVRVGVVVRNGGMWPVPWVLLEDMLPAKALIENRNRLRVRKKRMKIALIWSRGQTKLDYEIEFKGHGYYQIGPLVLESGDLFGLHRRYRVGTEPHFVLVYPKVVPLQGYDLASRRPIGEVRLTHRLFDDPTRLAGVRAYQTGDPLKRIHWRATARTGELHSKLYEPSTIAGATLLLDFHESGYDANREPQRSDLAVIAAASLANALYQMGQQVGLVTNGRDAADRIRVEGWAHDFRTRDAARRSASMREESDRLQPIIVETRRGVEQFQRIRETLARVELTDGLSFAELVSETAGRIPRDATVIALLGQCSRHTAIALGNLRRQGFAVVAILIVFTDEALEKAEARLLSESVEVRRLKNEAGLPWLCQGEVLR